MNTITTIVQKLWHPKLYFEQAQWSTQTYLIELTWLLGLKLAPHLENFLPVHLQWDTLIQQPHTTQLSYYQKILQQIAQLDDPYFAGIYAQANSQLKNTEQLQKLISTLSVIDSIPIEELGEIYEHLLQRAARENHDCVIPPRALVDMMVILTQPCLGDLVLDPSAGVGSLLIAADQYMTVMCDDDYDLLNLQTVIGMESELSCCQLALMNCLLHQVVINEVLPIIWDDCLLSDHCLPKADVVLSHLLFHSTDYQICAELIQYGAQQLKPGGRAALIVPDEIFQLYEFKEKIFPELLQTRILHTVLRLPIGIFYPHEIKAHLLFFRRGTTMDSATKQIDFYDLRCTAPIFGPQHPLKREHLLEFELAFGDDPKGHSMRNTPQWRCLKPEELSENNLDIFQGETENIRVPDSNLLNMLDNTLNELEDVQRILQDK